MLQVRNLHKHFGGVVATDHLDLEVKQGEVHALIGPNGAGKTTLIGQLTGLVPPDSGTIRFDGKDLTTLPVHVRTGLGLARSFQVTSLFLDLTVLDNVALAVQAHAGHSFRFWKSARSESVLRDPARKVLAQVGLSGLEDQIAGVLAHGQQRQLEIAMALATDPKLLLLDEPMAGMGPEESAAMVDFLRGLKGGVTMLLVEHDMDAVFALADRITVLVYGRAIATGTPEAIRENPEVRVAYLGEDSATA